EQRGDLALPCIVDRLAEHAGSLLRRVEPHAVLGGDEVETPLCPALQLERRGELVRRGAPGLGRADGVEEGDERLATALQQVVVPLLDGVDPRLELGLGNAVAGLAGPVDVEERAAHPVIVTNAFRIMSAPGCLSSSTVLSAPSAERSRTPRAVATKISP